MYIYFTKKTTKPIWLNTNSPQISSYDIVGSWDAEFTTDNESSNHSNAIEKDFFLKRKRRIITDNNELESEDPVNITETPFIDHKNNNVVSYQFALYHIRKNVYLEIIFMFYRDGEFSEKPTLEEMLLKCAREFKITPKHLKEIKMLLISHYSQAEWSHLNLENRKKLISSGKMQLVRKVPISLEPLEFDFLWEEKRWTKLKWKIDWRDSYLLAPDDNKSLDKLGTFTKNKKEVIDERDYAEIHKLFDRDSEKFVKYALNDVRVCLEYYCKYFYNIHQISINTPNKTNGVSQHFLTVGSTTVGLFFKESEARSVNLYKFKNKDDLYKLIFGLKSQKIKGKIKYEPVYNRKLDEFRATSTYQGALNTSFYFGHYKDENKEIFDCDFKGYYPACASTIPIIDWNKTTIRNFDPEVLSKWKGNPEDIFLDLGFFRVHFRYLTESIYQPALPVSTDSGLIYPLEGVSFCTWPELLIAYNQGVGIEELEAITLHKWEFDGEPQPAFSWYLQILADLRFGKYSLDKYKEYVSKNWENCSAELQDEYLECLFFNELLKMLGCNFYGKLAQNLQRRTVTSLIDNKRVDLQISLITNPYLASLTTGMARAGLVNLINYFHEIGGDIISATTDGCMVALPKSYQFNEEDILEKPKNFPIKLIANSSKKLSKKILDLKYKGDECYSWRTRANSLLSNGKLVHIARGNVPKKIVGDEYDLSKFSGKEITIKRLISVSEMNKIDSDLVMTNKKRVNYFDYDWKRIINDDGKTTRPPKSKEEWEQHRTAQRYYHKLGTEAKPELVRSRVLNPVNNQIKLRTVIRLFLKVSLHLEWSSLTNKKLVEKINSFLISKNEREISLDDLKNWKRDRFYTNSINNTKENKEFLTELINFCDLKCPKRWDEIVFIS